MYPDGSAVDGRNLCQPRLLPGCMEDGRSRKAAWELLLFLLHPKHVTATAHGRKGKTIFGSWFLRVSVSRGGEGQSGGSGCMYLTVKTDNDHDAADREAESMMGNQWV